MQSPGAEGKASAEGQNIPLPDRNRQSRPHDAAANSAGSQVLLAIFERPPEAVGQAINSAVVIAAESRSDYPQVKIAADYLGAISDLAGQSGLKAASDPYSFATGAKQLIREDFTGEHGKLAIYQSSLVMIEKGEIVSFTFVGGGQDEVDSLIANLHFPGTRSRASHLSRP